MQIDRINNINNIALKALLLAGVMGPIVIWFNAFRENHIIIRCVTFVIYCGIELIWLTYLWFVWVPVTAISIILIVGIDFRYGSRLEQYQDELKQNRLNGE